MMFSQLLELLSISITTCVTHINHPPQTRKDVLPILSLLFQIGLLLGSHHLTQNLHPGIWSTSVIAHFVPTIHLLQGLSLPRTTLFNINIKLSEIFYILFLHHVSEIHCVFLTYGKSQFRLTQVQVLSRYTQPVMGVLESAGLENHSGACLALITLLPYLCYVQILGHHDNI